MTKDLTKVVYKPDSQSTDEYIMIVNNPEYEKWTNGDTTIPLSDVVDSFAVFYSVQGNQGHLGQASKQQLDTVFGTHKDVDVAEILLKKGSAQPSNSFSSDRFFKAGRGDFRMDNRGSATRTTGV